MQAASIVEVKKELATKSSDELKDLCLRLAKFKKENKELLTYLLFEAQNEDGYIQMIKNEIEEEINEIDSVKSLYYTKKSIRKILKNITKYIRFSGSKTTELEVIIFFCQCLKESNIPIYQSTQITNLYNRQKLKLEKTIANLHEDIQADYQHEIENL